MIPMK